MELSFHGAAHGVTGSCHRIRSGGYTVLLDCGLFQGRRKLTRELNQTLGFEAHEVDAVVQSHAHIDHSGRLPVLVRLGFEGKIHATQATRELCELLLADCAHILDKDAQYVNKQHLRDYEKMRRAGKGGKRGLEKPELVEALYSKEDVDRTMRRFRGHDYEEWFEATPNMRFRFHDAGHILGSAWVEAEISEPSKTWRLVFTGDYGRSGLPLLRNPKPLLPADIVITESTYGDRQHPDYVDMSSELQAAVERLHARGRGKLLIPAFAVGRTQDVLYTLGRLFALGAIPRLPVYVDSPLATAATRLVRRYAHLFNEEALSELEASTVDEVRLCPGVQFLESPEESKSMNFREDPLIILSASGMMEQGRILHHLKHGLPRKDCEVLAVGFQAEHTLGRRLIEGAEEVRLLGTTVPVRARVTAMHGFSAHADRDDLLDALRPLAGGARTLFLVHGEDAARASLRTDLEASGFRQIEEPMPQQNYSIHS
jgi:metallo-beta-lactamase family protein